MKNCLISVIVPAYNIEKYIAHTLDSILNQTYTNLEVIIVNDGSKDNTPDIIDEYAKKDSRVKVIHKPNGGVTAARLTGVAEATGEYIGFVDGDDYIEPTMFELLLNNAVKYGADISHCGYQMVFPSRVDYYYNTGKVVVQDNITGIRDLLSGAFIEPGLVNKLYSSNLMREFLLQDLMDRQIKINEDLLMNYYLFKCSKKSVFEDVCPYHYMVRKGSAATSSMNEYKLKNPLAVWKRIYEDVSGNYELTSIANEKVIRRMIHVSTLSLKANRALIQPYRKTIRKELRSYDKSKLSNNLRLMALWAAYLPASYRFVHNLYSKLNGNDKKYEVS